MNHKNKPKAALTEGDDQDPWRKLREKPGVKMLDEARREP